MANQIVMPKLGNSVETCLITEWLKNEGDSVAHGDVVCTVETDKATVDVEATASGVVLKLLYPEGEEVPVLKPIVIVGKAGEIVTSVSDDTLVKNKTVVPAEILVPDDASVTGFVSPRARNLALAKGLDVSIIPGTGPSGRIIERDVLKTRAGVGTATPAAIDTMISSGTARPAIGTGIGGRILLSDVDRSLRSAEIMSDSETREIPVKGVRKIISDAMLKSITTTAQVAMHSSANAENLLALRKQLKNSSESFGLNKVSVNDLVMFSVVRTLRDYPKLNAHFLGDKIVQYSDINLGIAVDTDRGLVVPVVKGVQNLSLKEFSFSNRSVYDRINENTILPDELTGATFTVTNLGILGIESFTPILNIPEVAILGVCAIRLKPVLRGGELVHLSHIGLSLTFNHQAIDGAPAARFLNSLCRNIEDIDLFLAL